MSSRGLILVGLGIAVVVAAIVMKKKMKEGYQDIFMAKDIPNDEMITRPSFSAQLAPRMDPFRNGEYNKLNGYLPNIDMQATPVNPLGNGSFPIDGNRVDYSAMGDAVKNVEVESEYANARLKKYSSIVSADQAQKSNQSKSEPFRMNYSGSDGMNAGTPVASIPLTAGAALTYLDPKDLLPQPDMASVLSKDPTDPNVFNYDRTLFSKLKRRNLNNVDFIRGDLPIQMNNMGWFYSPTNPSTDLMIGSMNIIAPDITQQTEMQDLVYTRFDHQYPLQANVVSGDLQYRFP